MGILRQVWHAAKSIAAGLVDAAREFIALPLRAAAGLLRVPARLGMPVIADPLHTIATIVDPLIQGVSGERSRPASPTEIYPEVEHVDGDGNVVVVVLNPCEPPQVDGMNAIVREHLGHTVPYDLSKKEKQGTLPKSIEIDNKNYKVNSLKTPSGINIYVLTGINSDGSPNNDVHVCCRGTADFASVLRDLEPSSPGASSLVINTPDILRQIGDILKTDTLAGGDLKITVSGHSLGAGDAQHLVTKMLGAALAGTAEYQRLTGIGVNLQNGVGVPDTIRQEFRDNLQQLKDKGAFTAKVHVLQVGNDVVQCTGESHIASDLPSKLACVDLLTIEKEKELFSMEKAHRFKLCNLPPAQQIQLLKGEPVPGWIIKLTTNAANDAESCNFIDSQLTRTSPLLQRMGCNAAYPVVYAAATVISGVSAVVTTSVNTGIACGVVLSNALCRP